MNMRIAAGRWVLTVLRHLTIISIAYLSAWLLRFDFFIPATERNFMINGIPLVIGAKMMVWMVMRLDRERWWEYRGFPDVILLLVQNVIASAVAALCLLIAFGVGFSRSIYILDPMLSFLLGGGVMFGYRLYRELRTSWFSPSDKKNVLIYGAGAAGAILAREILTNANLKSRLVGFLDDDPRKPGSKLLGVPIFGNGDRAKEIIRTLTARRIQIDEILIAMPTATSSQIRSALQKGRDTGLRCTLVPALSDLLSGKLSVGRRLEMSVSQLLGREPVELDINAIADRVAGRTVLVTGAAGSIGTELCFQLSTCGPRKLIALDRAESELFRLEADLRAKFPELDLVIEVGDICDASQTEAIIERHAVNSIYHAAAYKHVPMMERQVCEAVRNNVIGTWMLARAAARGGVSDFLLISSDKAVNPTSVMGLTKRVAELIVSAKRAPNPSGHATKFVSVRFGNVLVSNGSVVPIFQKQIAAGGPVTVTHADVRRYFMTIQEAVALVLEASTMGRGSEIFLLDMGRPVKILDLAHNMIRQAGLLPGEDIEIKVTGLRPGEKIFEELSLDGEDMVPTKNPKISIFQSKQLTLREIAKWIVTTQYLLWRRDVDRLLDHMRVLVPEYQPGALRNLPENKALSTRHASPTIGKVVETASV